MFNKKITLGNPVTSAPKANAFIGKSMKAASITTSENGAKKYSTTQNAFVDQFASLGKYKVPREFVEISKDCSELWALNPLLSVCFILFLRAITRVVSLFDGTKTETPQRGAGLRYEGQMRMMWLAVYHPDTFWKNIQLFISVGSWKDVFQMLSTDLRFNGWNSRILDWNTMGKVIMAGLENPNTTNLILKYIPAIKSNSACKTQEARANNIIAKWLCSLLFGGKTREDNWVNYRKYRKMKAAGTAHSWQQLISKGKHDLVNFETVHGRALAKMVSGKYIKNQGLEPKYLKWIQSKPVAKFTGFVHELFEKMPSGLTQELTVNAQFMGMVETAKKGVETGTKLIIVRDTSNYTTM